MASSSHRVSRILSLILALAAFVLCLALAIRLPALFARYLAVTSHASFSAAEQTEILILFYCILLPAFVADAALIALLRLVGLRRVFTPAAPRLIGVIVLCCFAESVLFALLTHFFWLSLVLVFAALFLGVVLCVVRSVIAEGTVIKSENDFTV